ncbi:hypothetical protein JAAARDRAFT_457340 [Jaapia argillacea MUCL 33604]|uniref:Uncharacterized protein n=1 Tax=Jaapia argillacea MUCL 33604 TaxID=933084 RepID=A0A067QFQ5_9AGAM|nr:hypothetical protein JAAARDRAFT_457340 [Jaapia argillacea MUCL 33604]
MSCLPLGAATSATTTTCHLGNDQQHPAQLTMMDSPDQNTNRAAYDPSALFASLAEAAHHISRTTMRPSTDQPEVVIHDGLQSLRIVCGVHCPSTPEIFLGVVSLRPVSYFRVSSWRWFA